jgi:transposase-like protein
MGFLDRLFGRRGGAEAPAKENPVEQAVAAVECPHAAVTARWESAADMGKTELVSSYVCESCGATFSREEGERLVGEAAERLRVSEEGRQERMGH